nr:MAG TPA: hypothetical protein [Caudoviricetes sp.]
MPDTSFHTFIQKPSFLLYCLDIQKDALFMHSKTIEMHKIYTYFIISRNIL